MGTILTLSIRVKAIVYLCEHLGNLFLAIRVNVQTLRLNLLLIISMQTGDVQYAELILTLSFTPRSIYIDEKLYLIASSPTKSGFSSSQRSLFTFCMPCWCRKLVQELEMARSGTLYLGLFVVRVISYE